MTMYGLIAIIITLAIAITYINHRFIKMEPTTAMMFAATLLSLVLLISSQLGIGYFEDKVANILSKIDFHQLLINGMLSYLLFAGSLTVDLGELLKQKWEVITLAFFGTIISTLLIGFISYYMLNFLGVEISLRACLLFGALISPTDPIAVLAMCKKLKAPKSLSVSIAGESLFNDGVGIVLFLSIYTVAFQHGTITFGSVSLLFLREAFGGIAYGIALGLFANWLIKPLDNSKMEILVTLGIVTGGYAFATLLNVSGPLAMVVAGIFLGNKLPVFGLVKRKSTTLHDFWELIDELLNAILFMLIGFELLLIKTTTLHLFVALLTLPLVLLVRFAIVALPYSILKVWKNYTPHVIKIMTWGGLRGGLAVALALSLPQGSNRDLILTMTYAIVVFSILIQGPTIKHLVKMAKN